MNRMRRLSRRSWLTITAGIVPVAGAVDGCYLTPRQLLTSTLTFGTPAADRIRVLQVSDVHLRGIGALETRLLEAVHAASADLIVFTGDMIDREKSLWPLEMLLREFPRGPQMFAIPGNWEYWSGVRFEALGRTYDRHDVQFLVNRSVEAEVRGTRIRVTGLDDVRASQADPQAALADATPLPRHLVLAHCPVTRDLVPLPDPHPASLMLSGHTHGGQIAPLGFPLVRPAASGRYVAGWYRDAGLPPLYVSRGIGTSMIPMRIGSTPELVQIDWAGDGR
jgi:predicted MPP superfamily phosphohydrolase